MVIDKNLQVTRQEVGNGERWEDGEGVSWEGRGGGGLDREVISLNTYTEPGRETHATSHENTFPNIIRFCLLQKGFLNSIGSPQSYLKGV